MDAETNRLLATLKGQLQTENSHSTALLGGSSQLVDRDGAVDSMADMQAKPQVWTIPASVGSDLTKPMVLNAIISQWATLEDTQKINTLLGIAHVGQSRMHQVTGEVRRIAQLAKEDASSDWVRTLGALIGEVGASGRMQQLNELDEPIRSEMEAAVAQVAAALEKSSLCLATPELSYLSSAVAKSIAPSSICDIYGPAPKPKLLDRLMAQARKKLADMRSPPTSRRPSTVPSLANRGAVAERDTSASSSRLGSPEPNGAESGGLFGGASDGDGSDNDSCKSMESDSLPFANNYRLPMNVKSSHCVDHVGRLSRLLAAAESVAGAGDRHASGDIHGMGARPGRGGHAGASGLGIRRGGSAEAGTSKLGMIAPRRRTTANAALPGGGLGAATSSRRADSSTPITHMPKKIRMAGLDEVAKSMGERERVLREEREKAAEEREAKRLKQQAEVEERKRRREENRQRKQAEAAAAPKRAKRRSSKSVVGGSDDDGGPSGGSKTPTEVRSPRSESSDDEFDIPLEYRMFTGDTPDRQALYTNTNALTDANRKLMYCFFKGLAMPPGTGNELKFVLNEAVIDDPRYPGKKCTELMLFKANLINGKWDKIRRLKR
ncbi:hypothetical protein IWW36_002557 [Coemansia brasiliensis]|uniref:Uncharacterized protein n=1 Tax=Coemansia brasiliensis TaxID=2650707 RepID=A0A9W8M0X7_9FUNG|nr:hypothetical protein IWW36_002557 [Coemansia brasiliensis]